MTGAAGQVPEATSKQNRTLGYQVSGVSFQRLLESTKHASYFGNLFVQDAVGVLG